MNADAGRILPPVRVSEGPLRTGNNGMMPIVATADTELQSIRSVPLFNGLIAIAVLLAIMSATWWREGRS